MGLTYFKRFRMEVDLQRFFTESPRAPAGYRAVPWTDELLNSHAEVKFRSFEFEIDANVFPCLGERDGCSRLMHEISRRDGFLPEATWLVEYFKGAGEPEPCGTVQGVFDRTHYGVIQNLGVTPGHRSRGLGTFLLAMAMHGFRKAGLTKAYLEVTAQNVAAVRLYQRLGFRKTKTVYKAADVAFA